jgi:gluconokinase
MVTVIMGVSSSGKTTIGKHLSKMMNSIFIDADDYHSEENLLKMKSGIALNQEDREPWLQTLRGLIDEYLTNQKGMILACSSLSKKSRSILGTNRKDIQLVYLKGGKTLIRKRMEKRNHFMPPSLLDSQFSELSEPKNNVLVLDIRHSPNQLVEEIYNHIQ